MVTLTSRSRSQGCNDFLSLRNSTKLNQQFLFNCVQIQTKMFLIRSPTSTYRFGDLDIEIKVTRSQHHHIGQTGASQADRPCGLHMRSKIRLDTSIHAGISHWHTKIPLLVTCQKFDKYVGQFVCLSVCLFVCLSVCNMCNTEKITEWILTKLGQSMDLGSSQVCVVYGDLDLKVKVTRSRCSFFLI